MREELEKLAAAGKISRAQIDPLLQVGIHGFVSHRSWGVGKIATWDWLFSKVVIDFQNRAGHTMDLAFAADSLKALPDDHILARTLAADARCQLVQPVVGNLACLVCAPAGAAGVGNTLC